MAERHWAQHWTIKRVWPYLAAVALIAALLAGVTVWQSSQHDGAPDRGAAPDIAPALTSQLTKLADSDSEDEFVRAAGDDAQARSWARHVWSNLTLLDVHDLRLRYVSGADAPIDSSGTRQARVKVTWTPGADSGFADRETSGASVQLRVRPVSEHEVAIIGAAHDDGNLPLWLSGSLERHTAHGAVVYSVDGGSDSLDGPELAGRALTQVRRVLPDESATSMVLIEAPDTDTMAGLVDKGADDVSGIAAVTTDLDGADGHRARVIFCNPAVFDTMDDRAAQLVVTHEATHALTTTVGSQSPPWVVEGFADWVALHDDSASLSTSAGQILKQVASDGPPDQLPSGSDFAASHDLGAVYESAWMIFRMLSEKQADADIIGFYRDVLDGKRPDSAAQARFGLTVDEITEKWRRYLEKSASTVLE